MSDTLSVQNAAGLMIGDAPEGWARSKQARPFARIPFQMVLALPCFN